MTKRLHDDRTLNTINYFGLEDTLYFGKYKGGQIGELINCKSLTSIVIPDSVTTLGYGIFDECTDLREIHCRIEHFSDVKTFDSFKGIDKSQITVYVPTGTKDEYRHHPEFQGFKAIVVEN